MGPDLSRPSPQPTRPVNLNSLPCGDARPWRTQRVLSHVLWDQDAARDLCRDYVIEHLGAADGVLIVDETGFLRARPVSEFRLLVCERSA